MDVEARSPAEDEKAKDPEQGIDRAEAESEMEEPLWEKDEHVHYSHRSPWLRAFVLGALDGLVSVASIMVGVGGGSDDMTTMRLVGLAAWIAGALSMGVGEYISVASQKDCEEADIEKEKKEQEKGPESRRRELAELTQIYINRGLTRPLAKQVAMELTQADVIRAHARDELGIDIDELANPSQAAIVSMAAFTMGAGIPLLAGAFVPSYKMRLVSVILCTFAALVGFGVTSSALGGARIVLGTLRVVIGGLLAMGITFAIGYAFGVSAG